MRYQITGFRGAVMLKDWMQDPITGRLVRGVAGTIHILEAKDMIGFDPGKSEANWIARVEGNGSSFNFPGCQVRCVAQYDMAVRHNSEIIDLNEAR